jgi:hypothetical protein
MASPLDQLYKTKLQLIAVLAVVGGIALLMLAHWADSSPLAKWLSAFPISELGSTLFATGLLAIFFEYVDRKHGDQRTDQRIRAAVRQEAPAIRDAVLDSFAFDPTALKNIASAGTLDRIVSNALGLRLGDAALAADVYTDVRDQIIAAPERWHDLNISIDLSPWAGGPATGHGSMFVATLRCEYHTVPVSSTMRFACVSNPQEYRDLLRDQATTAAWYFDRSAPLDAADREALASVGGHSLTIRRTTRKGAQLYSATIDAKQMTGEVVSIAYTYRVLVQRHGHVLYLDFPRPAKGLRVQFNYADADIRRVNTLDFIASAETARVEETPSSVPARSVDIGFDGWVFPKSGIAFVWVLRAEMEPEHGDVR